MNLDLSQYPASYLKKIRHAFIVASVYGEFNVNDPIIPLLDQAIKDREFEDGSNTRQHQNNNSVFDRFFKNTKLG